jgi:hypothetical protein
VYPAASSNTGLMKLPAALLHLVTFHQSYVFKCLIYVAQKYSKTDNILGYASLGIS